METLREVYRDDIRHMFEHRSNDYIIGVMRYFRRYVPELKKQRYFHPVDLQDILDTIRVIRELLKERRGK